MHIFAWSPNPYAPKHRRRPMVTPVHRFQRIDSMLIDPRNRYEGPHGGLGRGRRWNSRPRLPRSFDEVEAARPRPQTLESSSVPINTQSHVDDDDDSPPRTSASPSRNGTLPDNFNRFRMGGWNWGLWICFIVVTALLVPAHLYLKQYAYRGELVGIFFIITLLFLVCFSVSMFHTKTRAILLHRLHLEEELRGSCPPISDDSSSQQDRVAQFSATLRTSHPRDIGQHGVVRTSVSTPDLQLSGDTRLVLLGRNPRSHQIDIMRSTSQTSRSSDVSPAWDPTGEPPPYDIAILLPTPSPEGFTRTCETPPPAYEIIQ